MSLINREDLIAEYDRVHVGAPGGARKLMVDAPEVMSEIIRCKDCKYGDRGIDEDGSPFLKCLGWVYGGTQEEDFCSHAERRIDEPGE